MKSTVSLCEMRVTLTDPQVVFRKVENFFNLTPIDNPQSKSGLSPAFLLT